jgi:hypothetical protein
LSCGTSGPFRLLSSHLAACRSALDKFPVQLERIAHGCMGDICETRLIV